MARDLDCLQYALFWQQVPSHRLTYHGSSFNVAKLEDRGFALEEVARFSLQEVNALIREISSFAPSIFPDGPWNYILIDKTTARVQLKQSGEAIGQDPGGLLGFTFVSNTAGGITWVRMDRARLCTRLGRYGQSKWRNRPKCRKIP